MEILKFFWVLFYVNFFTIGGGLVMVPLLHREIVENHHWLTSREFIESIAIGQVTPGPLTMMNAFIGYKIFGFWGSAGALVSTYLPSIIIVTAVSRYYLKFRDSLIVKSGIKGIKPAVIGLIAAVLISLGRESIADIPTAAVAISSFSILAFTKIDPTFVILGAGLLGAMIY